MENTIHTLQEIFTLSTFSIPQYQRAYAWNEEQLTAYLNDLRQQVAASEKNPEKSYFLGTLLLHQVDPLNDPKNIHIVDGQQRLTTSVIFIAAALKVFNDIPQLNNVINTKTLQRNFIYDSDEDCQKFNTIQEDNPFFRSYILKRTESDTSERSPSSTRLKAAYDFFAKHVEEKEWVGLLRVLISAKVMVYSVLNSADATLVFELQNDRGKKLTDLEALKSYLMHLVYLHAKNPKDGLAEIQSHFANIYRDVEGHISNKRIPNEDSILSYHSVGELNWLENEWRRPKELVKRTINGIESESIQAWILSFVANLQETYRIYTVLFKKLDDYPELSELLIIDRMASFWPLIIKNYKYDKTEKKKHFRLALRLMEVYALRGYGLSNIRSDAGLSSLYRKAREFNGDFQDLHTYLHSMSYWYDLDARFRNGVDRTGFYRSNRRDALYILWRYENHLRSQKGKKVEHLSWNQYLQPKDDASKLSLEHIAAQNNPISESEVEWVPGMPQKFLDVATHRVGNLVLDSVSANSTKGRHDFSDKLKSLSTDSTYLSQGELINWAEMIGGKKCWTVNSIKKRQEHLKDFVFQTWSPEAYFTPKTELAIEEPMEDETTGDE